jgi:FlaA1/EpsC-like NDP-sugar epimerase
VELRLGLTPSRECDTYRAIENAPEREHASWVPSVASEARNGGAPAGDVPLESVLGRPVVDVDVGRFGEYLADATVLVTGAGGSIGAELCAQLTRLAVGQLVLVDHSEASLVERARTLRDDLGFANTVPVLADIRCPLRTDDVFARYRPDVVFHAAAYKHVPLLEASPVEGVATNVLGTKCVVDAARRAGVGRFVLFSTDKAVQPTNVLGQTKAVAEWIVAAAGREPNGRYTSVRLGNVVDSTGSILPMFRRQVARGGPVTVTHPKATRYLMTADEGTRLAIVAGSLADPSSIFWLDSGPPVRILDLARRLVSAASGEVAIELVGLREGERLHERFAPIGDEVAATACAHVRRSRMREVDPAWLNRRLAALAAQVERVAASDLLATLAEMHVAPEPEAVRSAVVVS